MVPCNHHVSCTKTTNVWDESLQPIDRDLTQESDENLLKQSVSFLDQNYLFSLHNLMKLLKMYFWLHGEGKRGGESDLINHLTPLYLF
jgi:hypothetical protein